MTKTYRCPHILSQLSVLAVLFALIKGILLLSAGSSRLNRFSIFFRTVRASMLSSTSLCTNRLFRSTVVIL
ncbi:MAG: hypothetical protein LBB78_07050 [Spirochaetaceae bacterium]|nr:hypothetical protein [Spirochaetaceae bacterium]